MKCQMRDIKVHTIKNFQVNNDPFWAPLVRDFADSINFKTNC